MTNVEAIKNEAKNKKSTEVEQVVTDEYGNTYKVKDKTEGIDDLASGKISEASKNKNNNSSSNVNTGVNNKNYSYENGTYDNASYHGKKDTNIKNKAPIDGQKALDNSIQIKSTSDRRVALVDGEIVILDQTVNGTYHGHVRIWEEMVKEGKKTQAIRNTLIENGLVTPKGRIIDK